MNQARLLPLGMAMIFVGFIVVTFGVLSGGGSSATGGFILIGPIPIIFGSGPNSGTLVAIGVVITIVMVVAYLFAFLAWRSGKRGAEPGTKSG
ncbi:MAG TPA: DUF131 domain-containing protein [Nitrososphaerales archaeon]|nr:DUF131 domain-containing protein [Nitrososphaerales archaeon]